MTNYKDPDATRPADLGPCRCPGAPHAVDTVDVVVQFPYADLGKIYQAGRLGGVEQSYQMAILLGVKRWNLTLPDGRPRPIDALQIGRLGKADVDRFMSDDVLGPAFEDEPLPNGSSAPLLNGSPGSATSTQPIPTPISSTPS